MMNPVLWLQMTNMISYQGLVRTFPSRKGKMARRYARNANVEQLLSDNPSFNALINKLKGYQT
ncbi:hypothetical protein CDN89_24860 [Escherichia coli]|nr:hypothetical protein CDN89_24860 [Escherichia coli]